MKIRSGPSPVSRVPKAISLHNKLVTRAKEISGECVRVIVSKKEPLCKIGQERSSPSPVIVPQRYASLAR